jgi:hypothetical protein
MDKEFDPPSLDEQNAELLKFVTDLSNGRFFRNNINHCREMAKKLTADDLIMFVRELESRGVGRFHFAEPQEGE